jgi:hypothetical protein
VNSLKTAAAGGDREIELRKKKGEYGQGRTRLGIIGKKAG